jgi:hypothetical protein
MIDGDGGGVDFKGGMWRVFSFMFVIHKNSVMVNMSEGSRYNTIQTGDKKNRGIRNRHLIIDN